MNSSHMVHSFRIIFKVSTHVCLNSLYYYYLKNNDLYHLLFWWKQKTLKIISEFCLIFFFKWDPAIFFLWFTTSRLAKRCLKLWYFVPWTFFFFPQNKQTKKPKNTLGKTKTKNKNNKKNHPMITKDNYLFIQRNKGIFKC